MQCANCGEELVEGQKFCTACGTEAKVEAEDAQPRFCTQCGAELGEGQKFCTRCGAKVEEAAPASVEQAAEPAPEPAVPATSVEAPAQAAPAEPVPEAAAAKKNKTPLIIGIIIAVVVVVAAIVLVMFFTSRGHEEVYEQAQEQAEEAQEDAEEELAVSDVDLSNTIVTSFEEVNLVTFPEFAISYPDNWQLANKNVTEASEVIMLKSKDTDAAVEFSYITNIGSAPQEPTVEDIERVYSSEFVPTGVQGTDHRDLGDFMVAEVELEYPASSPYKPKGSDDRTFYAVIPEKAMKDHSLISAPEGAPAFSYSGFISVYTEADEDASWETKAEIIAILSSFRQASESDIDQSRNASGSSSSRTSADYVLPESSTRLITQSDLKGMSDYELFLARNEIYARHGRIFQSEELRKHFGSKSWYKPTIQPEDFSDSMLSDIERKNAEAIKKVEQSHDSPYLR